MRDNLEIYRHQPIRITDRWNLTYPGYCEGRTEDGMDSFPILRKGRADSVTGPSPYPTPYYGFKAKCNPMPAKTSNSSYVWGYCRSKAYRTTFCKYLRYYEIQELYALSWDQLLVSTSVVTIDGKPGLLPNVSAETRGRAVRSANNKLRSDSINVGQTIGEMPEAIRELRKFLVGIGKTILALKKGNVHRAQYHLGTVLGRRRAVEATQGISNAYLFYKFGVAPVLNDINNLVGEVGKALSQPDFIKVKGTATRDIPLPNWSGRTMEGHALEVCEVGYSVRPKPHYAASFLGLTNPIATLWELVPLSFVINWFVSIGDSLNALDAGIGLDFVSGYETTVVKGNYRITVPSSWATDGTFDVDTFAMERKVLSSPSNPGFYFKNPLGLGPGQWTTISALLMSAVNAGNLGSLTKAK